MASKHGDALGRPLVTASKDELTETGASGLFEAEHAPSRISSGKNLIFSSVFGLVWEEVARAGGSTILMQYDPSICLGFQGERDYRNDIDPAAYFASASYGSDSVGGGMRAELREHFGGRATATLIPDEIPVEQLFAYAYMFKSLVYDERDGRAALVAAGPGPGDFILDLPVTQADDRLLVASIPPGETLAETVARTLNPRAPFTSSGVPAAWALEKHRVPKIHFDVTWRFRNTSCRYVLKLDEFGATVLGEAAQVTLPLPGIIVARSGDRCPAPLLVVMTRRTARRPYFAAWIENTELLIPDAMG